MRATGVDANQEEEEMRTLQLLQFECKCAQTTSKH